MLRKITGLSLLLALGGLLGCGGGLKSVEGLVTLDGKPVEGATVTFSPEGGGQDAFGVTDSGGKFTLRTVNQSGAKPGNYKVTVVKNKAIADPSAVPKPGSPDYTKMQPLKKGAGPGMPMPPGGAPKSELPAKYASLSSTPFTVKIPPDTSPVKLDMTSK